MSEAIKTHPKTMACDMAVTIYEQMILEAVVQNHEVALHGLVWAYEQALRDRYPYKEVV